MFADDAVYGADSTSRTADREWMVIVFTVIMKTATTARVDYVRMRFCSQKART